MAMAAGAGGLTSYLSLAPGTERVLVQPTSALPLSKLNNDECSDAKSTVLSDDPGYMQQLNTGLQLLPEDSQHYGQETQESLSPLSKHIMEHEKELKLLKKKKRQPNPKQYQQNSSQIVATSYKSRHAQRQFIPAQPDHSSRNNAKVRI